MGAALNQMTLAPNTPATTDALTMPSFACAKIAASGAASPEMTSDMVNPMPGRHATPNTIGQAARASRA